MPRRLTTSVLSAAPESPRLVIRTSELATQDDDKFSAGTMIVTTA